MNKLFHIIFMDDTTFEGGTLQETKWKDIPNKPIKSILYNLGNKLKLSGYDAYYHLIEVCVDLNGINKGKRIIQSIKLLAKKDFEINVYNINNNTVTILDENDEFIKKLNPIYWKKGGK